MSILQDLIGPPPIQSVEDYATAPSRRKESKTCSHSAGSLRILGAVDAYYSTGNLAQYDISPSSDRFVMLKFVEAEAIDAIWVQNFFEELKARVPN